MIPVNELITKVGTRNIKTILSNVFISSSSSSGTGDVTGPSSSLDNEVVLFSSTTGKTIKSSGGIKFVPNTTARNYTFQDRDGEIADTFHLGLSGLNRYYTGGVNGQNTQTVAHSANAIRLCPEIINKKTTISQMAVEVSSGTTGNFRMGIYDVNASGYPNNLLYSSGSITVTAPGVYTVAPNIVLLPGIYYKAYFTDTANTVRAINPITFIGIVSTIGSVSIGGLIQLNLSYTTLPNPFTAGASYIQSGTVVYVGLMIT
jgi:hypothetical protein